MLNAEQVQALQNAEPTDFTALDQRMVDASSWDRNRFAHDDKLHVRFHMRAQRNEEKSKAAGRAIFEDTEYVEIMVPGDKNSIINRPVVQMDRQRWPKHYAAFRSDGSEVVTGTPLKLAPFLTNAQVEEFAHFKIRTVEQLANMNDSIVQRFMGGTEFKRQAQEMLSRLTSNDSLLEAQRAMQEQMLAMREELEQLRRGGAKSASK